MHWGNRLVSLPECRMLRVGAEGAWILPLQVVVTGVGATDCISHSLQLQVGPGEWMGCDGEPPIWGD